MSVRTSLRRQYAMAEKAQVKQECSHPGARWMARGKFDYRVCTICGTILKKVAL